MSVMITNGNNVHSPEAHAEVTAGKIIDIAESASTDKQRAGREIRKAVEAIILAHHVGVHEDEQRKLSSQGSEHARSELVEVSVEDPDTGEVRRELVHQCDSSHHDDGCRAILDELVAAAAGTVLASHFQRPEVQEAILAELHHETRSQMVVHRMVHERGVELAKKGN